MNTSPALLIELGTEELPPRALPTLSVAFTGEISRRLREAGLTLGAIHSYASPRRLAVLIHEVPERAPDQAIERRGPAIAAAFNAQGEPTGAALGFARSCGVEFSALERLRSDKGEWLVHRALAPGRPLAQLVQEVLEQSLAALPIPKRMRWGSASHEFVRPVHWLVVLHGASLLPAGVYGIESGRETRGHRFMSAGSLTLAQATDYARLLESEGRVLADFAQRRERIRQLIDDAALAAGGTALVDPALLDEVCALVEWPSAITGSFDAHFLQVPREALIASMQGHQKYFPLEDANGALLNRFITIANLDSPQPELIRQGNERVIRPRLTDADFFWRKDLATPLATRRSRLDGMVFERRLGSLGEKSERVATLARTLAAAFGADPDHAERAARLSRCDLVSEMVGEFPELQGVMGSYYARHDGEHTSVVQALREFYQPRYAGDDIPASPEGRAVALADKLDTLVGIFGIGSAPSGDKDPYALRRAALGALRICLESDSPLDLRGALGSAAHALADRLSAGDSAETVFDFVLERSRGYFQDRGHAPEVIEAVLCLRPGTPRELARRIAAVTAFMALPQARALAAANKRIGNLLRKAPATADGAVETARLVEPAEVELAQELTSARAEVEAMAADGDYTGYLARLARLREPVDRFFDGVMVMADDPALRDNRLRLLLALQGLFLRVADLSQIPA